MSTTEKQLTSGTHRPVFQKTKVLPFPMKKIRQFKQKGEFFKQMYQFVIMFLTETRMTRGSSQLKLRQTFIQPSMFPFLSKQNWFLPVYGYAYFASSYRYPVCMYIALYDFPSLDCIMISLQLHNKICYVYFIIGYNLYIKGMQ